MPAWLDSLKQQSDVRQCIAHWFILFGVPATLGIVGWVLAEIIDLRTDLTVLAQQGAHHTTVDHEQNQRIARLETWMMELFGRSGNRQ